MNQPSMFLTAFWAGLASPVFLYAQPTPYPLGLGVYTVGGAFAQVGMTLNHSAMAIYGGPAISLEYTGITGTGDGSVIASDVGTAA